MEEMDRRLLLGAAGIAGIAALARPSQGGPLNPPAGAVSGTGRTLSEVYDKVARTAQGLAEARTPVQSLSGSGSATHVISAPGSYYLTDNITASSSARTAITVTASDVTIDLNGFTVSGQSGSPNIVVSSGAPRTRLHNGRVALGLHTSSAVMNLGSDAHLEDLHVTGGSTSCGERSIVRRVSYINTGGGGITVDAAGLIEDSVAQVSDNAFTLQRGGRIRNCVARSSFMGISLNDRAVAESCTAVDCRYGFNLLGGCEARACIAHACIDTGFLVQLGGNLVQGCRCQSSGNGGLSGAGIRVLLQGGANQSNVIADNHCSGNWRNIDVQTNTNVVVRNLAAFEQGGGNIVIAANNTHGPVVFAGQQNLANVANANHPQANITY